jgi:hypothetical protein
MAAKTPGISEQKKQYTVPCTDDVHALVTSITNKYVRAIVELHPTDDDGPMAAGIADAALFTSALQALDERLDREKPQEIVDFIELFKKKRGPHSERDEEGEPPDLLPKRAVKATSGNSSSKPGLRLSTR